jgi:tripartite-type tricarboxylate transporter receptor subunit TctC
MNRSVTLVAALSALALISIPAAAQQFPAAGRTITTIVPVPAGGGTDQFARAMAPVLARELGTTVQVVNKPGASMQTGTHEVATSRPDGYTLLWIVLPTAAAYLDPDRKSTYARKDLLPVGSANQHPPPHTHLATSPYKTLKDLVDAAKQSPGKFKGGTAGALSTGHLASLEFQRSVGIKLTTVNFQGGAPQMTALLGGHIDVAFNTIGEALPHAKSGAVRILGVMSDQPHASGIATIKSQGFPTETLSVNVGLVGPAGLPKDVVAALSAALKKALDDDSTKKFMLEQTLTPNYLTPEQYVAHWDKIDANFKPLIDLAKQDAK